MIEEHIQNNKLNKITHKMMGCEFASFVDWFVLRQWFAVSGRGRRWTD